MRINNEAIQIRDKMLISYNRQETHVYTTQRTRTLDPYLNKL